MCAALIKGKSAEDAQYDSQGQARSEASAEGAQYDSQGQARSEASASPLVNTPSAVEA